MRMLTSLAMSYPGLAALPILTAADSATIATILTIAKEHHA